MNDQNQENYVRSLSEQLENTPYDLTRGQVMWLGCWGVICMAGFTVGLWQVGVVALVALPFAWQTHDGVVYQRIIASVGDRRQSRSDKPFFAPAEDDLVELDEANTKGKRKAPKRHELRMPFHTRPLALKVPYFGEVHRGIMYDPVRNSDRFIVTATGWNASSQDLRERSASEADLAETLKEILSELDGGIRFKFISGSRPRNIYPYAHQRYVATRDSVLSAVDGDEGVSDVDLIDADLLEELLLTEKEECVDSIMTIELEVPRPAYWNKALSKHGYLVESEIERSPVARVMVAAYEGLSRVGIQGVEVMDMPSMLSSIRSKLDIGNIDEFHKALHFATLRHAGSGASWSELFGDQLLWPQRIPKYGRDWFMTDHTIHRVYRMYRFRLSRVLPGFIDTLHYSRDNSWWFTFIYSGLTVAANNEAWWLTKQIVFREGAQRVFKSGDRYESLEERDYRLRPQQRQDELYMSRGPALKSNKYMTVSVALPELSDGMDEDDRLEAGLHRLQMASDQFLSKSRRLRIVCRSVKRRRQFEEISGNLA